MHIRLFSLTSAVFFSLLQLQCGGQQQGVTTPADQTAGISQDLPPTETPVGELILALLDTTAAGPAAVDERLGLQVGPHVRAFYGVTPQPVWSQPNDSLTTEAKAVLALLDQARAYGLQPEYYATDRLVALRDSLRLPAPSSPQQRARLDVYLSDAVLRFMLDLHRGRLRTYAASPRERATRQVFQPADLLRESLTAGKVADGILACQPHNREYRQLQQALEQWLSTPVPADSVAQYQVRYEQVALNLERWRQEAISDSEYLLINLPAYKLEVVRGDSVVRQHRVIVGQPKTPSPTLSSTIDHFTLAPDWHVPRSIATKEILPILKKDVDYLARNNFALYDERGRLLNPYQIDWQQVSAKSFAYTIRQSAGCDNALGNIVFRFKNPYSVYLHDTPVRQAFTYPMRALSHGCIRLQNPMQLAAYLLARGGQFRKLPTDEECARQSKPQHIRLAKSIPLHVRYFTCATENGQLRFYPDIYQRDKALKRALTLIARES
ncbi:L,D-transpeptidase family protein [Hymenobacter sp. BT188]|uniref:L,D-transpeptidase family protein n=1 Tax=Hymenobacter sp. BT188 TaxID=2763504 RepID=UPI001650E3CB|nr:L,D-transpeptidase family protein [Hymenobacter sp. BT188]MBC6608062.1 L,D-transpeptidase family protein [Hymenobacter sp. BT188]